MKFTDAVNEGIEKRNWDYLEKWITENSSFTFEFANDSEHTDFPKHIFQEILSFLKRNDFLSSPGASNMLRVIEYDWGMFSDEQKVLLVSCLENAYADLKDALAWFIVSEILGHYAASDQSFQSLCDLSIVKDESARSLIPMGFSLIMKRNHDLSAKAYEEIKRMSRDPSDQVRREAVSFL